MKFISRNTKDEKPRRGREQPSPIITVAAASKASKPGQVQYATRENSAELLIDKAESHFPCPPHAIGLL